MCIRDSRYPAATAAQPKEADMATATARRSPKLTPEIAHDQLIAGVEAITTSDQWLAYLAVAARFTRYSANNTFLIMVQRQDATRVAGFHTWKSLGRSVK